MALSPSIHNSRRKYWLVGLSAFFISLGVIFLLYWFIFGQFSETTDDAYVAGNTVQVMSHVSGQVTEILAEDTQVVTKGDPVIKLDVADAEIALNTAKEQLAVVVRQVNQYFDSVREAKANVSLQKDNLEKADEDYKRRQGLVVNKTISEEELRHAKLAFDAAQDAYKLAKEQLTRAKTLVGNTDLYHHPQIKQAAVNLRNAYLNWRRTVIYAPETGIVGKRFVQVGQEVNPNTVLMIIVPLEQVWVDANFKESQLKNIRTNQPVELVADSYGSGVKFTGKVEGLNPATGSVFDILPPQNATGNWIKIVQRLPVRIAISPQQLKEHPLEIGLSMTVTIDTHNRQGTLLKKNAPSKIIYQSKDLSSDLSQAEQLINDILQTNAKNIEPLIEKTEP